MTINCKFKEIKEQVDVTIRVGKAPTRKQLRESEEPPIAVAEGGQIRLFKSGYAYYTNGENETVVDIRNCYDTGYVSVAGTKSEVTPEVLDETDWSVVVMMRGEEQLFKNSMNRKGDRKGKRSDIDTETEKHGKLELEATAPDPLDRMLQAELVEELLGSLTDRQREAVTCYFIEKLSQEETAERMGIKQRAVSYHIGGAMKKLKKVMSEYC